MGVLVIYKIELSDADIELIGAALDELPFKKVIDLSKRFQSQIDTQNKEAATAQSAAQAANLEKFIQSEISKRTAKVPSRKRKG